MKEKFNAEEYYNNEMCFYNGGAFDNPEEVQQIIDYCLSIGYKKVSSDQEYYQVKLMGGNKDDILYFQTKHDPWNDDCLSWHWDYGSRRWSE